MKRVLEIPWRRLGWRLAGPLACLALLFHGALSSSKPHHSYLLNFSLSGIITGHFEAGIELDDGSIVAPVDLERESATVYRVALPTRTIRGIRLIAGNGPGAGIIRDLQITNDAASVYRRINFDAATAENGLQITELARNDVAFQIAPDAAHPSLDLGAVVRLAGPMSTNRFCAPRTGN